MNTTQTIESQAAPKLAQYSQEKIDMLCHFYTNMSIEALRKMGFEVRVNHFRYSSRDIARIRKLSTHRAVENLVPMYELRADYDMSVQLGEDSPVSNYIASTGGKVEISVIEKDNPEPLHASAICSTADAYNKKKGVLMCLGNIFNQLCKRHGVEKRHVVDAVEMFAYSPIASIDPKSETLVGRHL